MTKRPNRGPVAGGSILAVTLIVGAIGGAMVRQPTAGLILGLVIGTVACLLIWLLDRRSA